MTMVPDFHAASAPRAPFQPGEVPTAGWFCIETTFNHPSPRPEGLARGLGYELPQGADAADYAAAHGFAHEIATAGTLALLERNFNRFDSGGRGLLITRDHASFHEDMDTRATGWIKALHAEPDALWAWIEWTPFGHAMVNNGEFVHFSTEYDYSDFEQVEGGAQPTRLAACTITNEPRHGGQIPCTNAAEPRRKKAFRPLTGQNQTTTMRTNNTPPRRSRNSNGDDPKPGITDPAANSEEPKDAAAANNDEEQKDGAAANSDTPPQQEEQRAANDEADAPGLDLEGCCQQAADLLGLPEDATPEDFLAAIQSLVDSNKELNDALEEANTAANARRCRNSNPRFRFLTARNSSRQALRGQVPNHPVQVRVGNGICAVNIQAMSKADYCANAVTERERSLGRSLTQSEYSAAYNQALRDYNAGISR